MSSKRTIYVINRKFGMDLAFAGCLAVKGRKVTRSSGWRRISDFCKNPWIIDKQKLREFYLIGDTRAEVDGITSDRMICILDIENYGRKGYVFPRDSMRGIYFLEEVHAVGGVRSNFWDTKKWHRCESVIESCLIATRLKNIRDEIGKEKKPNDLAYCDYSNATRSAHKEPSEVKAEKPCGSPMGLTLDDLRGGTSEESPGVYKCEGDSAINITLGDKVFKFPVYIRHNPDKSAVDFCIDGVTFKFPVPNDIVTKQEKVISKLSAIIEAHECTIKDQKENIKNARAHIRFFQKQRAEGFKEQDAQAKGEGLIPRHRNPWIKRQRIVNKTRVDIQDVDEV